MVKIVQNWLKLLEIVRNHSKWFRIDFLVTKIVWNQFLTILNVQFVTYFKRLFDCLILLEIVQNCLQLFKIDFNVKNCSKLFKIVWNWFLTIDRTKIDRNLQYIAPFAYREPSHSKNLKMRWSKAFKEKSDAKADA